MNQMEDLRERTVRGGLAKVVAQGVSFFVRVGSLMILARLLDPKDFGLVGMVTAVVGVLNLFRDFGLSTASVQRVHISEEQVSTLFWINMLVGALLASVAAGMAPFISHFYREPALMWVTVILSASFLFNAAGVQHQALLQRDMRFTTLSIVDILSISVSSTIGILMALKGFAYWSLVASTIAAPLISSLSY
ncbi:MAG: lipopolysaccharide biosynthesis protein, partial [Acidobacteria bacterium]